MLFFLRDKPRNERSSDENGIKIKKLTKRKCKTAKYSKVEEVDEERREKL